MRTRRRSQTPLRPLAIEELRVVRGTGGDFGKVNPPCGPNGCGPGGFTADPPPTDGLD